MPACIRKLLCVALTVVSFPLHAETATVRGYWLEPAGAVLRVGPCRDHLCIEIVTLSPGNHAREDVHNPNPTLRGRSLCGLRIGDRFIESDARHAHDGQLYDPRSGRTYHGSMTAEGDLLKLRGFIGIQLLGRTETWTRARVSPKPCRPPA